MYNKMLGLGLNEVIIQENARKYYSTLDIPIIKSFRETHPEEFNHARLAIKTSSVLTKKLTPVPFANIGVISLCKKFSLIGYFTGRHTAVRKTTKEWLKKYLFPSPSSIVLCNDNQDKVIKLLRIARKYERSVILVDDSWAQLAEELHNCKMINTNNLLLVGFKLNTLTNFENIPIYPLASWKDKDVQKLTKLLNLHEYN